MRNTPHKFYLLLAALLLVTTEVLPQDKGATPDAKSDKSEPATTSSSNSSDPTATTGLSTPTASPGPSPTPSRSIFSRIINPFQQHVPEIVEQIAGIVVLTIMALLAVATTWLSGIVGRLRKEKTREVEDYKKELREPKLPKKKGYRRCSIILCGIGGTGKTKLVKALVGRGDIALYQVEDDKDELPSQAEPPDDPHKTRHVRAWDADVPWQKDGDPGNHISLSVVDYVGQNLGTLVRYYAKQQKVPRSPVAYGHVNAIVFLVDLRKPSLDDKKPVPKSDEPDWKRVEENIRAWNEQAVSTIWGMVARPKFKKIVIFCNKWDLIAHHGNAEVEIKRKYKELFNTVGKVFPGTPVEWLLGSAESGDGTNKLKDNLWDSSDPGDPSDPGE